MNLVELLTKARDHIAEPGMFYQGGYSANGESGAVNGMPCCAMGALIWAHGPVRQEFAAIALSRAAGGSITLFNDAPGRTQAEVVAVFDKAIAAEGA